MFKRRRRFKGTWFPAFGTQLNEDPPIDLAGINDSLEIENNQGSACQLIALLPDQPDEDFDDTTQHHSLADFIGSEYALRRIVGKFHAATSATSGSPQSNIIKLGLGFFISRVDPTAENVPVGTNQADTFDAVNDATAFQSYSPLALSTTRQPWIWRRTWALSDASVMGSAQIFPASTAGYGSVADGPHIDAKTRRRVRKEERLFAAIGIEYFPPGIEESSGTHTVRYDLDLRFFGALRKSKAQGAF